MVWGTDARRPPEESKVRSVAELDEVLDKIARMHDPVLVTLQHQQSGAWLALGVGASSSVLTGAAADGEARTCCPAPDREDSPLVFNLNGDLSEYLAELHLDNELARETARQFFETGELPAELAWEGDW